VFTAAVLYGIAVWLVLWTITSAELNYLACPGGYSALADQPACRRPALLQWGAAAACLAAVSMTVIAIRHRKDGSASAT